MTLNNYKLYDKVELIHTDDQYTELKSGDRGIITDIIYHSDFDQIWVNWYNGSRLALLSDVDKFKIISEGDNI